MADESVPIFVKLAAVIGAVHLVQSGISESDAERTAHGGLAGPLVGFVRGIGNNILNTFNGVGSIAARLLPPKNPKVDLDHIADGLAVLAGPALLAVLLSTIYVDAQRKGEFGLTKRDPARDGPRRDF
eukprot:jgi/Mesen1/6323/ME000326S05463